MTKGEREMMAGMKRFPDAPPCILFGLGGVLAEAIPHHRLRLAPLSRGDALSMIESPPLSRVLGNFRGMKAVDKEALSSLLIRLGHLALHFPHIKEIDLNPIIIENGHPKVVDALIVCQS
jgi:acetyltransferase